ncbi:MAG: glutamate synthase subunit alpha, partial [Actinomycetes bacterium]
VDAVAHWKAAGLDLTPILHKPDVPPGAALHQVIEQDHGLEKALDCQLIEICQDALETGAPVRAQLPIRNVNRTVGTMLGSQLTRRHGGQGLPEGTIDLTFVGSAGQSFGAFVPRGITLRLEGDVNDYLGKGLSGGRLVVRPDRTAPFEAHEHIIAGNVIAYGATSGEILIRGKVGERCCVRNSGATVVVEGAGDHLCEYMTGGRVVVLGEVGRNVAAGMSGGIAYLLDLDQEAVNREMVDCEPLDEQDRQFLTEVVTRHRDETDSAVATDLLTQWQANLQRFSKVMPRDFKRVLEAMARAQALGEDVDEAVMEAARG